METHYVTTEDKYILRVHRIPKPGAPPVFLMHGLEDSSATWILMGPQKAPGKRISFHKNFLLYRKRFIRFQVIFFPITVTMFGWVMLVAIVILAIIPRSIQIQIVTFGNLLGMR